MFAEKAVDGLHFLIVREFGEAVTYDGDWFEVLGERWSLKWVAHVEDDAVLKNVL